MRPLLFRFQHPGPLELAVHRMVARRGDETEAPQRLEHLDLQRPAHGFETGPQRARHTHVALRAVVDDDEAAVDHVHVVVDAERELQRGETAGLGHREPVAVEEARVARADVVERGRELVPERVVERPEHVSPRRRASSATKRTGSSPTGRHRWFVARCTTDSRGPTTTGFTPGSPSSNGPTA